MKSLIIFFLLIVITHHSSAQKSELLQISEADKTAYYDTGTKRTIYPNLNISKTKGDSIFYHNNLIFYKGTVNKNGSIFFEIFNDSILIACYRPEGQLGMNDPAFIKREFLYIVELKQPSKTYCINLKGKRIVKNKNVLNMLKAVGEDVNIIFDIDILQKQVLIENSRGATDTLTVCDMITDK